MQFRNSLLPNIVLASLAFSLVQGCRTNHFEGDGEENWITDMAVTVDGNVLVSTHDDGFITFRDTGSLKKLNTMRLCDSILTAVACSPSESSIACSSLDGRIWYFNCGASTTPEPIIRMPKGVLDLCFSPNGETVYFVGRDQCLHAFNLQSKESTFVPGISKRWIESIAIDSNGELLATGDWGGNVAIWNAKTLSLISHWNVLPLTVLSLKFVPHTTLLAVGAYEPMTLTIWDYTSRSMIHQLTVKDTIREIQLVARGEVVSAGSDGWLRLWNLESAEQIGALKANPGWISALAVRTDFTVVYTGSMEGEVKRWNLSQLRNSK